MTTLTQDIFIGQPEWVISAAACANGRVLGFSCRSEYLRPTGKLNTWIPIEGIEYTIKYLGSCYFMDDWGNSAIDRV